MQKNYELAALWMVALVLTLPIVSAQSIQSIQKFEGRDGIPNIVRSDDTLEIEVLMSVPGESSLGAHRFQVLHEGQTKFASSCTKQSGDFFLCKRDVGIVGGYGVVPFQLYLMDAAGTYQLDAEFRDLKIDSAGAEITSLNIDSRVRKKDAVIEYSAEDTLDGSDSSDCAGIDKIELFLGGATGSPIQTRQGSRACAESGSFDAVTFSSTGLKDVCAIATDRLGQEGLPRCTSVEIDDGPPKIKRLNVTDDTGATLKYVSADGTRADLVVAIEGNDLVSSSVRADLSSITGRSSDDSVRPDIVTGEDIQLAVWEDIFVTASACQVKVTAEDDVGNEAKRTLGCNIQQDNNKPQLELITSTRLQGNSTPVLGSSGRVIASITESGSGLHKRLVFLDASNLGLPSRLRAHNCSGSSGSWSCFWDVSPTRTGTVLLTLAPNSMDDVGNFIDRDSLVLTSFIIDQSAPASIEIKEINVLHAENDIGNVTIRGDIVEYKVQGTQFTDAFADFTDFGGSNASVCERSGDVCTFTTEVTVSGPRNANARFSFVDSAGNEGTLTHTMKIFGIRNESNPNYWKNSVICTPATVDRSVTSLINTRIYCHIDLTSTTPDISTAAIDFNPGDCVGDVGNIVDLGMSNNHAGSTEPILYTLLGKTEFRVNSLDFVCPLKITSKIGSFVNINHEFENVSVSIGFYELPQEDLASSLEKKFDKAKDDALKLDGLISTLTKLFEVSEKICQVRSMIMNALAAMDSVMGLIDFIKTGLKLKEEVATIMVKSNCELFLPGIGETLDATKAEAATGAQKSVGQSAQQTAANAAKPNAIQKLLYSAGRGAGKAFKTVASAFAGASKALFGPFKNLVPQGDVAGLSKKLAALNKAIDEQNFAEAQKLYKSITIKEGIALNAASMVAQACITSPTTAMQLAAGNPNPFCPPPSVPPASLAHAGACFGTVENLKKLKKLEDKFEDARKKICGQKGDLTKKFTDSIDKFAKPFCQFVNCQSGPVSPGAGTFQNVMSAMGGGLGLNPNRFIPSVGGVEPGVNVKSSMVWSVASLCIPGIVHNVDSYRQINCEYALCIGRDVVERGLPVTECEKKKEALMCNFIWNQVFNSVPFVSVLDNWVGTLKEIVTNPVAALTLLLGQYCKPFCGKDKSKIKETHYKVCAFPKTLDALSKVVNDLMSIKDLANFKTGQTACDQLRDFSPSLTNRGISSEPLTGGDEE